MPRPVPTVGQYMTPNPVVIDGDLTLADASARMFQHDIRHLPVYSGGHLVGIVSDRDVAHTTAIRGLDPQKTTLASIATPSPFVCAPESPLAQVVAVMRQHKLGAALVMQGGQLLGMFTVIDALGALVDLLERPDAS